MVNWRLQKWLKEISITKVVGERYKSGDIKNYKSGQFYYKSGDFITKVGEFITKVVILLQKWSNPLQKWWPITKVVIITKVVVTTCFVDSSCWCYYHDFGLKDNAVTLIWYIQLS